MRDMQYGISRIETYLPEKKISSDELAKLFGFDLEFVENKIGVKQLYVVESQKTSDLAVCAMNKLLEFDPSLREELDFLVVCTQTPDFQLPQISALVQSQCGLKSDIASFDIGLGCSGFVYGLSLVNSFLLGNAMKRGVLITAETYSRIIDPQDRNTKCLFSDGATATLIEQGGPISSGVSRFGTNGDLHDHLIVRKASDGRTNESLYMNGRGIFEFAVSTIPNEIRLLCEVNNTSLEEIDYFVFHQASKFVLDSIARKLGIYESNKMVNLVHVAGNTVSSSIPMALEKVLQNCQKKDVKIIISGFGVGLSWASTLLTVNGNFNYV